MTILEYDKMEFRLSEIGHWGIFRTVYKELVHKDGFYHFKTVNGDYFHIPENQVIVKEYTNSQLPRL
mgnify:CR=1 FL=1